MSGMEIDVAGATEAMNSAGGFEHLMASQDSPTPEQTPVTPSVTEAPTADQVQHHSGAQTRDQFGRWIQPETDTSAATATELTPDTFTGLDPNALPAELQPYYKSLQADYTRKTQQIAEQRKQYEQLGPLEEVQRSLELARNVQDPQNWPQLYSELNTRLQSMGLTPQQAHEVAANEVQTAVENVQPTDLSKLVAEDPDLAPVKSVIESLQQQVLSLSQTITQQQEQARAEQMQTAIVGELTRQEMAIRQNNPKYTDADINAIYELSSYHDGDLLKAQERYDGIFNDRLTRYMEQKQGASQGSISLSGGGTQSQQQAPAPKTLDEAYDRAMEAIRAAGM